MLEQTADNINKLGEFLGKRDINKLTKDELESKYGFCQADVMVLFGGSIICGGDVLAEAIINKIAKHYVIVGGEGHTTQTLRNKIHEEFPEIKTKNLPEAKLFELYIKIKYDLTVDLLECESTNCGNNITYLLDLLNKNKIECNSIIIAQDATMQFRMEAVLRKYKETITIINHSTYSAKIIVQYSKLEYEKNIYGMWDINHYISLLLGEIPRLTDDLNGYGPKGKNYIVHVEIPDNVKKAFLELSSDYSELVRIANPKYASL